jgi:hypothetical protein
MALPFWQRLVSWLARPGRLSAAVNTEVGREAVVRPLTGEDGAAIEQAEDLRVSGQEGAAVGAATLDWQGGVPLLRGGVIDRSGFVFFLARDDTVGVVAAGIPAEESVLRLTDPRQWRKSMQDMDLDVVGDLTDEAPAAFMAALGGRDVAPWLLAAALLLLLVEIQLGRGTRSARA